MRGRNKEKGRGRISSVYLDSRGGDDGCSRVLKGNADNCYCLDIWSQFEVLEISLLNRGDPFDLTMTQFLVYRMGEIDDTVRLDSLKTSQIIQGAVERGFLVMLLPLERFCGHFSHPYSMLLPSPI